MTELEVMQRAKMYMDKLAQGIDPISDREMPEDSVLNNVRLARCFFYVSDVLGKVIANGGQVGRPGKMDYSITPEQLAKVRLFAEPVRITEFSDAVHRALGNPALKKPSVVKITNWLLAKGFLAAEPGPDGKNRRVPTAQGAALGLTTQLRQSPEGEYLAIYYSPKAQQFILDNLDGILQGK